MAVTCEQCGEVLSEKDIVNEEKEYSYICRGEVYEELEDIPNGRRDEARCNESIIITYECSNENCGAETTIEK